MLLRKTWRSRGAPVKDWSPAPMVERSAPISTTLGWGQAMLPTTKLPPMLWPNLDGSMLSWNQIHWGLVNRGGGGDVWINFSADNESIRGGLVIQTCTDNESLIYLFFKLLNVFLDVPICLPIFFHLIHLLNKPGFGYRYQSWYGIGTISR